MSARLIRAAAGALLVALAACSGGGDATGPNHNPRGGDPGGGQQNPPPAGDVTGVYVLANVNDDNAGQTVTLSNPGGNVIGIYRFDPRSSLTLNRDGTWTLSFTYDENGESQEFEDHGTYVPDETQQDGYVFRSARFEDEFHCLAKQGVALMGYDFDGNGEIDTIFAFGRLGSQG